MPGVKIGDGAIIAAYHIVGGNPIKIIRKRFDDELILYLLELKWWNWPAKKIFSSIEILCSSDLEKIKNIK